MIYLLLTVDLQVVLFLLKLDLLVLGGEEGTPIRSATDIRKSFLNAVLSRIEYKVQK